MKVMSVRLSDDTYEQLEAISVDYGVPPAVLARYCIKGFVEDRDIESAMKWVRSHDHPVEKLSIPGVGTFVRQGREGA
jgi:predicted transcriptional regulator